MDMTAQPWRSPEKGQAVIAEVSWGRFREDDTLSSSEQVSQIRQATWARDKLGYDQALGQRIWWGRSCPRKKYLMLHNF